ncbi:MAG: UDP-N-acetylmuramoyl-L-alanine--D-glutamate ligase [Deltaproteobacteria bacterium]|nr:UDP-N-acetylmuramoyl-L-alanine--D-glutamate ligase [Deltaproteobacteria bacterium]
MVKKAEKAGATGLKAAQAVISGQRALVMGLASTGAAAAKFLKKCGAVVAATDMRKEQELESIGALRSLGVEIEAGGHREESFKNADMVVVSPGVPFRHRLLELARRSGAEVISDIELAGRFVAVPIIAIAGTNGKSTATALIGEIIRAAGLDVFVGGNIGTPAVEYFSTGEKKDFCVLEVSSFHLETTKYFNPHIAVLLNITEDHLDRYADFNEYAETKFRLFENQTPSDYAVVNAGDSVIAGRLKKGLVVKKDRGSGRKPEPAGKVIKFTVYGKLDEGLYLSGDDIVFARPDINAVEVYPTGQFGLKGLHNIENIMAVIAASRLAGITHDVILKTLSSFRGLRHRMEFVREIRGAAYIDDSKGTNIGALLMALKGLNGNVILIAGGKDKGGDYGVLSYEIRKKVKLMLLIGEARFKIKEALGALTETVFAGSMEEAVARAHSRAGAGDTVLLCPACSSFDMFRDYKERGDRFRALVEALC